MIRLDDLKKHNEAMYLLFTVINTLKHHENKSTQCADRKDPNDGGQNDSN